MIGAELPDPPVGWPNDTASRGGHATSARLVRQAAPHSGMPVSTWGTSSSNSAGDGNSDSNGDAGADLPAGRVATPAAATWAKWPNVAGPPWLANEPGASMTFSKESSAARGSVSTPASWPAFGLARTLRRGGGHRGLYCWRFPEC